MTEGIDFVVKGKVGGGLRLWLNGRLGAEGGEGCRVRFERAGKVSNLRVEAMDLGFEVCE